MPQSKTTAKSKTEVDAITLLTEDHKRVKKLFQDFEKIKEDGGTAKDKSALVKQICTELSVHAKVEEEIFYPAVREAIDDEDLMDEAEVEHAGAKDLIAQLQSMKPGDDQYDAKVTVLGEYIDHHVKEEQADMFAQAKKAKVDTVELGEQIAARKEELLADPSLLAEAA
jgi:hemerythrin superfamily protein